ncbi:hypothetical protein ACIA8K_39735 [Catenuloplanes sp. NPDC051500]|uniref:hypothetical protein n=1 Tax=Catenuloplanes sp. NPDC051500 TaxID=3363959 RepID=UPI0037AF9B0B
MKLDGSADLATRRAEGRQRAIASARKRFKRLPVDDQMSVIQGFDEAEEAGRAIVRRNNHNAGALPSAN